MIDFSTSRSSIRGLGMAKALGATYFFIRSLGGIVLLITWTR